MRWSYKTVHYGFKKEGLLGNAFVDEAEIEESLNQFGHAGWELISLLDVPDGMMAVFKQPLGLAVETDVFEPAQPVVKQREVTGVAAEIDEYTKNDPPKCESVENEDANIINHTITHDTEESHEDGLKERVVGAIRIE